MYGLRSLARYSVDYRLCPEPPSYGFVDSFAPLAMIGASLRGGSLPDEEIQIGAFPRFNFAPDKIANLNPIAPASR
jgi:hypothetical protein